MLSGKQKADYLAKAEHCPFCGEEYTEIGRGFESDYGLSGDRIIVCPACHKSWYEIYTLTDIEEVEA